ncbi:MAG: LysR family transcriptional regulator [Gammaproteobacteria bacterium]|nr:LysR family transcriptional regulator [Gammaproteobacteria bacterium]
MRINTINWNDLNIFLEIAREKTLSGAALKLGVAHSTIFRRINNLESNLKVKLFSRNPDGYQLTEIGKEVLADVKGARSHVDAIHRLLDNSNSDLHGDVYVTAPHNLAYRFMPGYIAHFRELYPLIRINLMVSNKQYNLSRLEADLAIRATSHPPIDLVGKKLFTLQWAAYASAEYINTHGQPNNLTEIKQHLLITSDKTLSKLPAYAWIEDNVPRDQVVMRCNDLVSMSSFSQAGIGISLLPDDQAKPGLIRLFELDKRITSDIWLLIHPDMRQCSRLITFRNFLMNSFRDDPLFQQYGIIDS